MNIRTLIAAVIGALVLGIFIWLLVAEKGRTGELTTELANARRLATDEAARLQDIADARQREIDQLTSRARDMETAATAAGTRIRQLESSVQTAERQLSEARSDSATVRAEADKLRADGLAAQKKVEEITRQEALYRENLIQAEARIKELEAEVVRHLAAIDENKAAVPPEPAAEAAPVVTECPPQMTVTCPLAPQVECPPPADCPPDASLEEKEQALAESARLKEEVARSQTELENLRRQFTEDMARLDQMKKEVAALATDREAAYAEAKSAREAFDKISTDLKGLVSSQELVISELKDQLSMTFMDKIFFAPGSATLTKDGAKVLDSVSEALKNLGDKKIIVIGHTDDQPISKKWQWLFPSNWELSAARASAVIRYFQEKGGLAPENLEAVGRAFYNPVAPNDTDENRRKNRRVEIIISNRLAEETHDATGLQ
ncbi:hypothetical protein C4J81_01010 [Deltaproteobacteria bacterium Smac51]|nr:hypothetical protein C4J81_01010 [Deltaproteobacteria bacterium Smac51]